MAALAGGVGCSASGDGDHVEHVPCQLLSIGGDRVREVVVGEPIGDITGVRHRPGTVAREQLELYADPDDAMSTVETWPLEPARSIAVLSVEDPRRSWPPDGRPERLLRSSSPSHPGGFDASLRDVLADAGRVVLVSDDVLFDDEPASLAALVAIVAPGGAVEFAWPCSDTLTSEFAELAELTEREADLDLLVDLLSSSLDDGGLRDRLRNHLYPGVGEFGMSVTPLP